MHFLRKI